MAVFSIKEGKTFAHRVAGQGLDIHQQLMILNRLYQGKVKFSLGGGYKTICIEWVAEDIDDLELPECEYISADWLFGWQYEGNVRTLRLPKCLKQVRVSEIDSKIDYIENLVIQPGTKYINDECVVLEKENSDGSTSEMKMCVEWRHEVIG